MDVLNSPAFVVTVSGSDASGGAGMQADNRAIQAMGAFPLNVITALTLQTDRGVESMDFSPPELVRMHLVRLLKSYPVKVVKAGMLGNAGIVHVLAETLSQYPEIKLVLDPVIRASSGRPLLDPEGLDLLVEKLLPHAFLITPNLPELAVLTGQDQIVSPDAEQAAANLLLGRGCHAVLVKGGHRPGPEALDRLYFQDTVISFSQPVVESANTRGTGCALASLVAAGLACGLNLETSIHRAKELLANSLQEHKSAVWPGNGPAFY